MLTAELKGTVADVQTSQNQGNWCRQAGQFIGAPLICTALKLLSHLAVSVGYLIQT